MDAPLLNPAACLGDQEDQKLCVSSAPVIHTEENLQELQATSKVSQQLDPLDSDSNNQNVTPSVAPMKMDEDLFTPKTDQKLIQGAQADDYPILDLEMEEMDDDDASFDYNESNNTNASIHETLEPSAGPSDISTSSDNSNANNEQETATRERPRRTAAVKARQHLANIIASFQPKRQQDNPNKSNNNSNNSFSRAKDSHGIKKRGRSTSNKSVRNLNRKKKQRVSSRSRSKLRPS